MSRSVTSNHAPETHMISLANQNLCGKRYLRTWQNAANQNDDFLALIYFLENSKTVSKKIYNREIN